MDISDTGIKLIQHYESCSLKSYRDSAQILTIGWGHTGSDVYDGMIITQDQADDLFKNDIEVFVNMLNSRLEDNIEQYQFDALVSFLYNVGPGSVGIKDGLFVLRDGNPSTLWRMIESKNFIGASQQFLQWTRSDGMILRGLVARRRSESLLFSSNKLEFFN